MKFPSGILKFSQIPSHFSIFFLQILSYVSYNRFLIKKKKKKLSLRVRFLTIAHDIHN